MEPQLSLASATQQCQHRLELRLQGRDQSCDRDDGENHQARGGCFARAASLGSGRRGARMAQNLARPGLTAKLHQPVGGKLKQPAPLLAIGYRRGRDADCTMSKSEFAGARALHPALHHDPRSKKQLRVGAARWLCSGHRPERPAWLSSYDRVLLTAARGADLPLRASAAGQTGRGERAARARRAPVAGSDDAEGRRAASRRRGGLAGSCGRHRSFDPGRSDPYARHQQGSCGRFAPASVRDAEIFRSGRRRDRPSRIALPGRQFIEQISLVYVLIFDRAAPLPPCNWPSAQKLDLSSWKKGTGSNRGTVEWQRATDGRLARSAVCGV